MRWPLVSVIILNYNGKAILDLVRRSVQTILDGTYRNVEIILADDCSTDGSAEELSKLCDSDRIRLTHTQKHSGVGAARNAGLRLARGAYIAFLDNDALPEPDWLSALVMRMEENPQWGSCASRLMFADRPDIVNGIGSVLNELAHGNGVCIHEMYEFASAPTEVMYATGNGMIIRRRVLDEVGPFDEGFRFYGHDDSDIGIRIRNAGYEIGVAPEAVVWHLHSYSKHDPTMYYWDERNRLRFVLKHYHWSEILGFIVRDGIFHLKPGRVHPYVRAWWSALTEEPSLWPYRWANRRLGPFLRRYARWFEKDHHLLIAPDNRQHAAAFAPLTEMHVGSNEEDYLYHGWFWRERWGEIPIRWAARVASIRFSLNEHKSKLLVQFVAHRGVPGVDLTLHLRRMDNGQITSAHKIRARLPDQPGLFNLREPCPLEPGRYHLIFEANRAYTEEGPFPRRIAFGLSALRFEGAGK
ncbi:MAG: glycosyltransferase family 2 protein [Chloroflexi bacterium]|nr:glycosyltransferase family 2 protein [Chloroflexota bacterium]